MKRKIEKDNDVFRIYKKRLWIWRPQADVRIVDDEVDDLITALDYICKKDKKAILLTAYG